uniref:Photosystem I reaction center subunit III n=1 Tax=Haptophyceae sp. NIES-3900 TaxID=2748608 RepID=A0A7R6WD12_9EUKA|nr:photosystem I reaction center subunit III [Haptophyceae sp. NIES-3900]
MKKLSTLFLIVLSSVLVVPDKAQADVAGLTPCGKSPAFKKRLTKSVKKLTKRLSNYEPGTPPYLALKKTIEKTEARFDRYGKSKLLCGTDGLPHLIVDGRWSHAGEFIVPGIFFLYSAGYIGWTGRSYLLFAKTSTKPTEKEIIIDVPAFLKIMSSGFLWPLAAWKEFTSGNLVASSSDVTVSPR